MNSKEIRKKDLLQDIEELKLLGNQVKSMEEKGYNKKFLLSKDRRQYNKLNHDLGNAQLQNNLQLHWFL